VKIPPEASLILLTSVLGASTNWLTQRFLYSLLPQLGRGGEADAGQAGDTTVVLASFLRDYKFWKDGTGRLGIDLDAQSRTGNFVFVDCLSNLFSGSSSAGATSLGHGSKHERAHCSPDARQLSEVVYGAINQAKSRSRGAKAVLILDNPDVLLAASAPDLTASSLQETILQLREVGHSNGFWPRCTLQ
jgi:elongator complex protein 6